MSAPEMPERIWYHSDGAYLPYQPTMHWEWQEFVRADLCASGQQVRALEVDDLAQIIDNAITPNDAETHRLLLDGTYHTGPVVDWVHRVMIAMRDLLRQDPSKAQAALEAYGREKVREGMRRAADLFQDANHGEHIMSAILAAMEKDADQ